MRSGGVRGIGLLLAATVFAAGGGTLVAPGSASASDSQSRIDLKVLVVTDGGAGVTAMAGQFDREGVPYDTVDLNAADRPKVTADSLSDAVDGVKRAKYQAVVLPSANPFADASEYTALTDFERSFGIRQFDAYVWPGASVGLQSPFYDGSLDGSSATVTSAGLDGAFRYLRGPVKFEDNDPAGSESWAHLAKPVSKLPTGESFRQLVTATSPDDGETGVVLGEYTSDNRTELVSTVSFNRAQQQFLVLAPGIVEWLTGGVHLGSYRNYLSVDVDDVFAADARWSIDGNCTPGDENCADTYTGTDIRMTRSDVSYAVSWQKNHGLTFDMFFNGGGSDTQVAESGAEDPLRSAFANNAESFRWGNHTYSHLFMGCEQDVTVIPWRCAVDSSNAIVYVSQEQLEQEISENLDWASSEGLETDPNELVTGEHSGLFILPQQPLDNPNLAPALTATGITWIGSDNSRDPVQRSVGSALTVPRYPINLFYNVATEAEEVDEYNWIYTSRADGGSGLCEDNPKTTTCITPLTSKNAFENTIIPSEVSIALAHMLGNDPRPHYLHQANLAEDRLVYPLLEKILSTYQKTFASNTPIVNQRLSANGEELRRQGAWKAAVASRSVTAYMLGGKVVVEAPAGLEVPISVPDDTCSETSTGAVFGAAYAGARSGYWAATTAPLTLALPAASGS